MLQCDNLDDKAESEYDFSSLKKILENLEDDSIEEMDDALQSDAKNQCLRNGSTLFKKHS